MSRTPVSREELIAQLRALGLQPGAIVVVHASFSSVGPVEGGPRGLIEALRSVLGAEGTLVMPTMSDDDEHPFDPRRTPCRGMGVVADTFWRMPGALRCDSPHGFAAMGAHAAAITAPQPLDVPHGSDSAVGRVHDLDGEVLLLGIGHDSNTTIHLAEAMAGVRYRRPKYLTILRDGRPARFDYREIDHCCENFALMDEWLDAEGRQRRGTVGDGEARLMHSRDAVAAALAHLRENETVFLHPFGIDEECDEARASLAQASRES